MSRAKYSPEKQRSIMATFINATADIIKNEGIEAISIRSVASRAGYSSATLYLYFDDINQLEALASISYLRDYVAEISSKMDDFEDPRDVYLYTWDAFCRHSFANAPVFMELFFGQYGAELDDTVKKYYSVFPHELEHISSKALSMLMAGNLLERNINILRLHTQAVGIPEEYENLINEITVSYYRGLLERACAFKEPLSEEQVNALKEEFLFGASWLIDKGAN